LQLVSASTLADRGPPSVAVGLLSAGLLAGRVSTHREAVTRELNRLCRIGIAERQGSALLVKNIERLAEMVHEATGE
jgi:Crp-like helix-turn-helix domain